MKASAQVFIPFSFWANQSASPLSISPTLLYIISGNIDTFTGSGGNSGNYGWSLTAAAITDGASSTVTSTTTMDYTARSTSYQTDVVTLTDGSSTVSASVVTYDALSISPSSLTIAINGVQSFSSTGGCLNGTNCAGGAYVYSLTGGGSINSSSGLYTAPATAGTAVVQVADSIGNTETVNVTIVSSLTISPSTLSLPVYSTNTFTAILGASPYTYSVVSGSGSVVAATGVYTAPSTTGSATVRVTDNISNTSDASVTIIKPIDIKVGQYFACALYSDGSVKCWGINAYGQLGIGNTSTIGDSTAEVGGANQFVNLGTGRTATAIATGLNHVCALLDNSTVKCWGQNSYGQLGQGSTSSIGTTAAQMGNGLASISLGTGRTATAVYAFGYVSCAKLDDGTVKCWGRNTNGQLGLGDTINRGTSSSQMGDSLPAINVGTGRTISKITGGNDFTCALLDNGTVKCWGNNNHAQLGKDNSTSLGGNSSTTPDLNTAINIGSGRTATDISSGYMYTCVKRDNSTEICWGRNVDGQCGVGRSNGQDQDEGDSSGEMAGLSAIPMGSGFGTLSQIWALGTTSCAMDTSNVIKCWGRGAEGETMQGNTTELDAPINAAVNFGTGLVVSKMAGSYYTLCALFTNDRIKCWGKATNASGVSNGVFLNGTSTNNLGDVAGETGNGLPYLNH